MSHSKANQRQTGHGDGEGASQRRRGAQALWVGAQPPHECINAAAALEPQVSVGAGSGGAGGGAARTGMPAALASGTLTSGRRARAVQQRGHYL